jgi:heterodisulfide reductase subunit A-like polyferredoxin
MENQSEWMLDEKRRYSALAQDTDADILVIGGGITGVTAAYLLSKAARVSSSWTKQP